MPVHHATVSRHLSTYATATDEHRQLLLLRTETGVRIVVDRRADAGDCRVLAELGSEEPEENAVLIADLFLRDSDRAARRLCDADLRAPRCNAAPRAAAGIDWRRPIASRTHRYRLAVVGERSEVRWLREPIVGESAAPERVSLRCVVGGVQEYTSPRVLTEAALAALRGDRSVCTSALAVELQRLCESPLVLNRRLRQAVVDSVARGRSLSSIALACGRVKRDRRGCLSGETSWLGRRVGLLAEESTGLPTPWVHTRTLGVIAREGLGLAPHEVELA